MRKWVLVTAVLVGAIAALSQPPAGAPGGSGGRGPARVQPDPVDFNDHPGWAQLFDGSTLNGWDGNPATWKVVDGAIVGENPAGASGQTFLIWKGGDLADFELKLEIKLEGNGADSGIQYRGYLAPGGRGRGAAGSSGAMAPPPPPPPPPGGYTAQSVNWNIAGYQFDFNYPGPYIGQEAEAGTGARGIIAYRGQVVRAEEGKKPRLIATLGTQEQLLGWYKHNDWNQIHLVARGNTFTHIINGHVMAIFIDEDATKFKPKGIFGLQCAGAGPVRISFRNIWLRKM